MRWTGDRRAQPAGEEARDELFGPAQRRYGPPYTQRGQVRLCGGDCADGVSHGHHAGHGQQRVIVSGDLVRLEMRERRLMGHVDVLPDAVPEVPAERGLWIVGDGLPGDGVGAVVQVDDAAQAARLMSSPLFCVESLAVTAVSRLTVIANRPLLSAVR